MYDVDANFFKVTPCYLRELIRWAQDRRRGQVILFIITGKCFITLCTKLLGGRSKNEETFLYELPGDGWI